MNRLVMLLAVTSVLVWASSCGDGHRRGAAGGGASQSTNGTRANPSSGASSGYLHSDGDRDEDEQVPDRELREKSDLLAPAELGRPAGRHDRLEISSLVKRYYAAATTGDGRSACSMLDPSIATGLAGGASDSTAQDGCITTTQRLFREQRPQLVRDRVETMSVVDVRMQGRRAVALVGFEAAPVGEIELRHERSGWKMNVLLDSGLT